MSDETLIETIARALWNHQEDVTYDHAVEKSKQMDMDGDFYRGLLSFNRACTEAAVKAAQEFDND